MDTNIAFTINIPVRGKNAQTQAKYAEELVAADKQGFFEDTQRLRGFEKVMTFAMLQFTIINDVSGASSQGWHVDTSIYARRQCTRKLLSSLLPSNFS